MGSESWFLYGTYRYISRGSSVTRLRPSTPDGRSKVRPESMLRSGTPRVGELGWPGPVRSSAYAVPRHAADGVTYQPGASKGTATRGWASKRQPCTPTERWNPVVSVSKPYSSGTAPRAR